MKNPIKENYRLTKLCINNSKRNIYFSFRRIIKLIIMLLLRFEIKNLTRIDKALGQTKAALEIKLHKNFFFST